MKKKSILGMIAIVFFAMFFLVGCATLYPVGSAYTNIKLPVDSTSNMSNSPKVGISKCNSYLGLIAIGDASIDKAMKNGGINKIHYVDWEANNILGIFGTYKVIVYGE